MFSTFERLKMRRNPIRTETIRLGVVEKLTIYNNAKSWRSQVNINTDIICRTFEDSGLRLMMNNINIIATDCNTSGCHAPYVISSVFH